MLVHKWGFYITPFAPKSQGTRCGAGASRKIATASDQGDF